MQDAVALERKGIPSVVLVTKPFNSQAKAMANLLGLPGYEYAVIGHPMGSLTDEQVLDRAKEAIDQVEKQLTA
ncbi:MAG: hypothetical protein BZY79_02765 [SAR202 cluster bacterium Casp-Chloro-G4]|nr:hypothetical protein [Chloroflexota bacterium]MDA1228216.1 hypothetical protein [Chloroflexota bacterium]PKB61618.1 MAG: hypothetical protein BZY79_02765 [SAR202 cluster bacterium Casp-Chloro-G4]